MNLDNLMVMGATAERAQNYEEAISYYNRVLEADPTLSAAWLGKGRSAGWLSTLANLRIRETIVAFGHAIATAADDEKGAVAEGADADLTVLVEALYGMARRHFEAHGAIDGARLDYLTAAARLSDALDEVATWGTGYRPALDATVRIARDLLDLGVGPDLAAACRERMDRANAAILAQDPGYVAAVPPSEQMMAEQQAEAMRVAAARAKDDAQLQNAVLFFLFVIVIGGGVILAANR